MAVYAIGDLQGCYDELQRLLDKINFSPAEDTLWFVGDLVNRGPQSLQCLNFVSGLGSKAITVLGNHDLSFLATALEVKERKPQDTFSDILEASNLEELIHWLRHQPLLHQDDKLNYTMVHAGLAPQWSISQAQTLAVEVETALRSKHYLDLLRNMYGDQPNLWSNNLRNIERYRFIINCLTRIRYCTKEGHIELKTKGALETQPSHLVPWFRVPNRRNKSARIIFGHWSTLGQIQETNVYSIDTGCVWGGCLTAMRLDTHTPEYINILCKEKQKPTNNN